MELKLNPTIVLVGNLNCGKSSLFNNLTGLTQKTGNYPGTTVEKKSGFCKLDEFITAKIIDLPGVNSIYCDVEDEKVVFNILNNPQNPLFPDLAVIVANACKLKESLILLSQVKDLGIPVVLAINMMDIAEKAGIEVNPELLRVKFGVQVVKIHARNGEGLENLKYVLSNPIVKVCEPTLDHDALAPEVIRYTKERLDLCNSYQAFNKLIGTKYNIDLSEEAISELLVLKEKHDFDDEALIKLELSERETAIKKMIGSISKKKNVLRNALSEKMDKALTHPMWGYAIFLTFLFVFSVGLFAVSSYPSALLVAVTERLFDVVNSNLANSLIGLEMVRFFFPMVKGIMSFIPHMVIFFATITLLEESGYMARVMFLMDKVMQKSGMNGKCLVPFFSGNRECLLPSFIPDFYNDDKNGVLKTTFRAIFGAMFQLPVQIILIVLFVPEIFLFEQINLQGTVLFLTIVVSFTILYSLLYTTNFFKNKAFDLRQKGKQALNNSKTSTSLLPKTLQIDLPNYSLPKIDNFTASTINNFKIFTLETGQVIFWMFAFCWTLIFILGKVI